MTDKLFEALEQVIASAQRDMARTNTDFLGRMGQTLCEYQDIFEEHPDGDLGGDVREEADEAILSLSGLALAQLFMLRGFNRSDVAALASRPEAGAVAVAAEAAAKIIDPKAMIPLAEREAEWLEEVKSFYIEPGSRPVDREDLAKRCAKYDFDKASVARDRAIKKAQAILALPLLAHPPAAVAVGTGDQAKSDGMDEAANFCIETLAKALDVDDWQIADGSETWDGDVAGTIYNVLKAGRVYDEEDGRVARLEDATPPRHPAGDVLREDAQFLIDRLSELERADNGYADVIRDYFGHVEPAIARLKMSLASTKSPDASQ